MTFHRIASEAGISVKIKLLQSSVMSLVWLSCYKRLKHEIEDAAKEEQLLKQHQRDVDTPFSSHVTLTSL